MSITEQDVAKVARLARLSLSEQETAAATSRLSAILDFVAQMNSVNTDAIEPLAHTTASQQPTRADVVTEQNQRDLLLANAPATENGLFLVPKVIE